MEGELGLNHLEGRTAGFSPMAYGDGAAKERDERADRRICATPNTSTRRRATSPICRGKVRVEPGHRWADTKLWLREMSMRVGKPPPIDFRPSSRNWV